MTVWTTAVVGLLAWTLVNQRRLQYVLRRASKVEPEKMRFDLDDLRKRVGVRRQVSVLSSDEIVSPAIAGLWQPRILLPANFATTFSDPQLRWIVLHELAHIRRCDLWFAAFQRTVQIVHFFNPAVWLTNWMINRQREFACDDIALAAADVPRRDCAAAFLSIVEQANQRQMIGPLRLGFLRSPNPLRRRLMRILDTKRPLRPRLTLGSILLLAIIASLVVPQLRPRAWGQSEQLLGGKNVQPSPDAVEVGRTDPPPARAQPEKDRKDQDAGQAESPLPPNTLKDRVESLETEVRKLREVLEDLRRTQRSATAVPQRAARLFAAVKRMDLAIANHQGAVALANPIKNRPGPGAQTTITVLAPNGKHLKKGDLVAVLGSEYLRDQLNVVAVQREQANAAMLRESAQYENQRVQSEVTRAESELQVELAKLELETFTKGTLPLELEKLEARVAEAEEAFVIQQRLSRSNRSTGTLGKAKAAFSIAKSDLDKLRKFENALQIKRLEGALQRATAALKRTERNSAVKIAQQKALKDVGCSVGQC